MIEESGNKNLEGFLFSNFDGKTSDESLEISLFPDDKFFQVLCLQITTTYLSPDVDW